MSSLPPGPVKVYAPAHPFHNPHRIHRSRRMEHDHRDYHRGHESIARDPVFQESAEGQKLIHAALPELAALETASAIEGLLTCQCCRPMRRRSLPNRGLPRRRLNSGLTPIHKT